jgi:membrane-bound lytic murein transglycosylase B
MRRLPLLLGICGLLAQQGLHSAPTQAPGSTPSLPAVGTELPVAPPAAPELPVQAPTASQTPAPAENQAPEQPFDDWLMALRSEALARGYPETVVRNLDGLQPLPRVIAADRSQAELTPGFDRYLSSRLTRLMVRRGQELARPNKLTLSRVEERFSVQREIILAIWGMETRYGRITGNTPVLRALATLAWEPRRAAFFRGELFDALTMVSKRHVEARTMTGSWAGAMGQTQFMPSSYLKHAVDFDDDGKSDIWRSTGDSLASIASYLKDYGWDGTYTWGREVKVSGAARERIAARVPRRTEGCYARRNMTERVPLDAWTSMGVTRADGGPLPSSKVPAGLVDVGERQFLVYPNYDAILAYNCAHYYALSVALLADAINK